LFEYAKELSINRSLFIASKEHQIKTEMENKKCSRHFQLPAEKLGIFRPPGHKAPL
jgi:hypothetical protein